MVVDVFILAKLGGQLKREQNCLKKLFVKKSIEVNTQAKRILSLWFKDVKS